MSYTFENRKRRPCGSSSDLQRFARLNEPEGARDFRRDDGRPGAET